MPSSSLVGVEVEVEDEIWVEVWVEVWVEGEVGVILLFRLGGRLGWISRR